MNRILHDINLACKNIPMGLRKDLQAWFVVQRDLQYSFIANIKKRIIIAAINSYKFKVILTCLFCFIAQKSFE